MLIIVWKLEIKIVSIPGACSTENKPPLPKRSNSSKEKVSPKWHLADSSISPYLATEMSMDGELLNIADMVSQEMTPLFLDKFP